MFIASVSFSLNQSQCLRWVTPSISWAAAYRGSLRRAHSVSTSGAVSISFSNMVLSVPNSCCWADTDLGFATSSFFRGLALNMCLLGTLRKNYFLSFCDQKQQSVQRIFYLSYVMDVVLSDYDIVDQMPMF